MRKNPIRYKANIRKTMVINDGSNQSDKKKNEKMRNLESKRSTIADAFFLEKKNIPVIAEEFGITSVNVIYAITEEYPNYEVAATINRRAANQNIEQMMNF